MNFIYAHALLLTERAWSLGRGTQSIQRWTPLRLSVYVLHCYTTVITSYCAYMGQLAIAKFPSPGFSLISPIVTAGLGFFSAFKSVIYVIMKIVTHCFNRSSLLSRSLVGQCVLDNQKPNKRTKIVNVFVFTLSSLRTNVYILGICPTATPN